MTECTLQTASRSTIQPPAETAGFSSFLAEDAPQLGDVAADPALHDLFCTAFNLDELRRFLATSTLNSLLKELPESAVSISSFSWRLIELANRHRLIVPLFFEELVRARPAYKHDIERIQELYAGHPLFSRPNAPAASQKFSLFIQWRSFKLSIVLGLGVSLISAAAVLRWLSADLTERRLTIAEERRRDLFYPNVVPWRPPAPGVCDDPNVHEFLTALRGHQCAPEDTSCPAVSAEQIFITKTHPESVLRRFSLTSVHFPTAKPSSNAGVAEWPDPSTKAFYLQDIRRLMSKLRSAKTILIIGRASPDGSRAKNERLARARVEFVVDLILEATESREERESLREKVTIILLGSKNFISPGEFKFIGADHIAWNNETQALLSRLGTDYSLDHEDGIRSLRLINQSVSIVPITCDIDH